MLLAIEMFIITKKSVVTTDRYISSQFLKVVIANGIKLHMRLKASGCMIKSLSKARLPLFLADELMEGLLSVNLTEPRLTNSCPIKRLDLSNHEKILFVKGGHRSSSGLFKCMAKAQKLHQYVFKLHTGYLAKHKWNLVLPLNEARKTPGCVVSLSDSQVLTWINELNGSEDKDLRAKEIKNEIKFLKKQPNSPENKKRIAKKYDELYELQFIKDYMCLVVDNNAEYDRANKGFYINGIKFRRFLATTGGVKMSTIVYVSERLYPKLKKRLDKHLVVLFMKIKN